jgi:hypothetical protein
MDRTGVANISISHLGSGYEIANIDTEQSEEARAVRTFWDIALDEALRDFGWPFSTKVEALSVAEEDPTSEWQYSYHYPSDCLAMRKILSGQRVDHEDSAVPYRQAYGTSGQVIYTDKEEAVAEYTVRVTDTTRWPPDFVMAHAALLAFYMAPRLTAGDPGKLGNRAYEVYQVQIGKARSNAINEQRKDKDPTPESIRARDY